MNARLEKDGASACFTDSEESEEEVEEETKDEATDPSTYGKKRKRTDEDFERENLKLGDLYGFLDLVDVTFEATEADVKKAYQKVARVHHPDKLGDKYGDVEKKYWLNV